MEKIKTFGEKMLVTPSVLFIIKQLLSMEHFSKRSHEQSFPFHEHGKLFCNFLIFDSID